MLSAPRLYCSWSLRCIVTESSYVEWMAIQATLTNVRRDLSLRAAALWLALAVALLSSLMSGGLPQTTAYGSAFNPATTAVALQPGRVQPRVTVDPARRDDMPEDAADTLTAILPSAVQPVGPFAPAATAPKPASAIGATAPPPGLDGNPRGPPRS